jgi:hypothetical protein
MQIDFHHTATYVVARLAGFEHEQANIIAYSAQYVDDAVNDNAVFFDNGAIYKPVCSGHRLLDYRNFVQLSSHFVWVPFHFIPANCMEEAGCGIENEFFLRVICKPNSYIAQEMVAECVKKKNERSVLYRFGISMHAYADTWAHQGFSGIMHYSNKVEYLNEDETSKTLKDKIINFFDGLIDEKLSDFMDNLIPLGHGAVLSYPDKPYLKWRYKDYKGELIKRNNAEIFLDAIKHMFKQMQYFYIGDLNADVEELAEDKCAEFMRMFSELNISDKRVRHEKCIEKLAQGAFGLEPIKLEYYKDDKILWNIQAFGEDEHDSFQVYKYNDKFESTHWKNFHEALSEHHHYMLHILFPKYKLCIA